MNHKSALGKVITLELLFGAIPMKCMKKTRKFPQSLMMWNCMSGKGMWEITVIKYLITHLY